MPNPKKQSGFTLVELLIAISILALVSATGIVVYSTAQKAARSAKRAEDLKAIKLGISLYRQQGLSLPPAVQFECISNSLFVLVPKYIPRLPADPLDNGDVSGPHCYEYSTANTTNEYKVRTNTSLNNGEMSATDYARQPAIVDPARDDMQDCTISSNAGSYSGWAVFDGPEICDNTEGEAIAF
jgi:prepilin-type N-terminal cleavage/methylation domain-containing protein